MNTRKVCAIAPCTSRKAYVAPIAPAGEDEMPHTKGAKDTKVFGETYDKKVIPADASRHLWHRPSFRTRYRHNRPSTRSATAKSLLGKNTDVGKLAI